MGKGDLYIVKKDFECFTRPKKASIKIIKGETIICLEQNIFDFVLLHKENNMFNMDVGCVETYLKLIKL